MTPAGELGRHRWDSRGDSRWDSRWDMALAGGLLVAGLAEIWLLHTFSGGPVRGSVAMVLAAVPLVWRRRAPLAVALVEAAGLVATAPASGLSQALAVLVAVFGVAAYEPLPAAAAGYGAVVGAEAVAVAVGPDPTVLNAVFAAVLYGAAWGAGLLVRRLAGQLAELRRLTEQLRQEQETLARTVVAAERSRIARELHDVIAHSVGVMVVQAGAAEQVLATDPERARAALESVQDAGQQAAVELRRLLGVLRAEPGQDPGAAPAPGLADLPSLVEELRGVGLEVVVSVTGEPRPLPPGADLAAYRVVQEALTNVLKHADARRVTVAVRHTDDEVTLTVTDDGASTARPGTPGHGLVGMAERCRIFGGDLRAGRGPAGFVVEARLPRTTVQEAAL